MSLTVVVLMEEEALVRELEDLEVMDLAFAWAAVEEMGVLFRGGGSWPGAC